MSENIHHLSGNLLVGSSHLFVDTTNNRVGITTADPDAGLHVNSNAYVHTDFRVGSGIVMNVTGGRITAGSFEGDGSLLSGVNSDSGSWVNGSSSNVHLATSTDKVGIGTDDPGCTLDVEGEMRVPSLHAQLTLSGGGDVTWTGSYVKWGTRVIMLPVDNSYYNTDGHINVPCPTSGTVPYYNDSDTITTKTCTSNGIPLGGWEAVYYVISKGHGHGSSSTSINSNFIVVNYTSSHFKPQSNWILICLQNDDDKSLLWKPGQINIAKGGVYSSTGGYVTKQYAVYNYSGGTLTNGATWRSETITHDGIAHINYHGLIRMNMRGGHTTTAAYFGLRRNSTQITDDVLGFRWATGSGNDNDRWRPIALSWSGKVYAGDVIKVHCSANEGGGTFNGGDTLNILVV
jgi:hypothetical protein